MPKRAIDAILAHAWAITPEYMGVITSVAERENEYQNNLQALEAKLGRPLGSTERTSVRDGIATVPVTGPIFRYSNLFTAISGATSNEMLAQDFTAAVEDPSVRGIILQIDSPGGEVNGTSEFAAMVAAARGKKPIIAYIGGTGASAAYWIASAADKIIASDTAMIGSIGVQMGFRIQDPKGGEKSYRFVSSNAKNKNAGPDTDAGAAQIQSIVDDLEAVFIGTVANNRGTTDEKVIQSYGQGAVFVAAEALSRGMIDGIGTYESVLQSLVQEITSVDFKDLTVASLTENRPDLVAAIGESAVSKIDKPDVDKVRAEAIAAERARITAIEGLAVPGAEDLIAKFKADGTDEATAAVALVKHVKANSAKAGSDVLDHLKKTEVEHKQPAPVTGKDEDKKSPDADLDSIIAGAQSLGVIAK